MRPIPRLNGFPAMNHLWNYYNNVAGKDGLFSTSEENLQQKTVELEEKYLDMIRSIEYASRIQDAMIPSGELFDTYFSDYFILNKPKEIVSGDFYWMKKTDNKLIFTIADCTGHGVPGAFISILGIMLLDQITRVDKVVQADKILNILKDRVSQAIHHNKNQEEMKEGLDLTLCIYDPVGQKLQFSGALDRIYQIRDHSLTRLQRDQINWGSPMDPDMPYELHEMNVRPGDTFYFFTDGYPDQFGGEKNKKFTLKRFQDLLMSIYYKKMDKQKKILEDTITNWQGSIEQVDDITVMGIRF
jgi:serine phosphatase RsbU (regulator of sigma subunit)